MPGGALTAAGPVVAAVPAMRGDRLNALIAGTSGTHALQRRGPAPRAMHRLCFLSGPASRLARRPLPLVSSVSPGTIIDGCDQEM